MLALSSAALVLFVAGAITVHAAGALLGLIAAGQSDSDAVRTGILWLRRHQRSNGTWDEKGTTGTGFPNVFYISYHLYRDYFPLLALTTYARASEPTETASLAAATS